MYAGEFPAPTPSAGLPALYAAFTMPGPPVAMIIFTSLQCMSSLVAGIEVLVMQPMVFSGAPASTAACAMSSAARAVHFTADGCGEKTMALRALTAMIDLKIAVEVGLVDGTMPMSRPTGSATSMVPRAGSSWITPMVFISLMASYSRVDAMWFLYVLSATLPNPVSSTAICARVTAFSSATRTILRMMRSI